MYHAHNQDTGQRVLAEDLADLCDQLKAAEARHAWHTSLQTWSLAAILIVGVAVLLTARFGLPCPGGRHRPPLTRPRAAGPGSWPRGHWRGCRAFNGAPWRIFRAPKARGREPLSSGSRATPWACPGIPAAVLVLVSPVGPRGQPGRCAGGLAGPGELPHPARAAPRNLNGS